MTTMEGDVGNSVSGGQFRGDVNQYFIKILRDAVSAMALDADMVRRIQQVHVATQQSETARAVLADRGAVALIGAQGSGRWITGIAVLAGLGLEPHTIVLDPEDLRRSLDVESGRGYLLDLDEARGQLTAGVGSWIVDLAGRVRDVGSCLVVRSGPHDWGTLGLAEQTIKAVTITAPRSLPVFKSHLRFLTNDLVADSWARREQVVNLLTQVRPSDAVRLAGIVHDIRLAQTPEQHQLDEVLAAYANWAEELAQWFHETAEADHGYRRALLLAIAALNGASAVAVCTAADRLADSAGVAREAGWPLAGPDLKATVTEVGAEVRDGHIWFSRPSYAEAVLDHVWEERPHLQALLRDWLNDLPRPSDSATVQAAQSLTALAMRQGDINLIASAAAKWAKSPGLREVAVGALTVAAMSDRVGRGIRRRLYDWARTASVGEELHLTIAQVCSGPLAAAYPQIALTRLRNLAVRNNDRVKEATIEALAELARDGRLRGLVLGEIATWIGAEEPRRTVGQYAFVRLAGLLDEFDHIVLLQALTESRIALLANLWREALRNLTANAAGQAVAIFWLEAAAQGKASPKTIAKLFAETVKSSKDLGTLTKVAATWLRTETGPSANPRDEIFRELIRLAEERDPLNAINVISTREPS